MYSNLKIFPLLFERETPVDVLLFSLQFDESPKREKESLFVEENTLYDALSLSACVLLPLSSLCVSAQVLSLSFL